MSTPITEALQHRFTELEQATRKAEAANCAATVLAEECAELRVSLAKSRAEAAELHFKLVRSEARRDQATEEAIGLGERCVELKLALEPFSSAYKNGQGNPWDATVLSDFRTANEVYEKEEAP
jgi:hypothetical protein